MDSLVIPMSEDGSRLDRCIRRILGNVNQGLLEKHLRSGFILLDNKKVKSSEKVKSGQLLQYSEKINFSNSTTDRKLNQVSENFYKTLYDQIYIKENDHYIALNKPSGLAVQGGSGIKYNIDEMLQYKFGKNKTPKLIHRIDKDTSGLLLVAKDQISAKKFANYFKERKF